jgi:hypothetical protein
LASATPDVLATRCQRASTLQLLGRYDHALAEVDAFAPVQTEVQGERHPSVLLTRKLRAASTTAKAKHSVQKS